MKINFKYAHVGILVSRNYLVWSAWDKYGSPLLKNTREWKGVGWGRWTWTLTDLHLFVVPVTQSVSDS